jgi:hypothetical protein
MLLRSLTLFLVTGALLLLQDAARAHHGWGWASDALVEVTGEVTASRLGNPHGELRLDVAGEEWVIEVGQPWRNQRAGLGDDRLAVGVRMTVIGNPSAREGERLIKAVRIVIDGENHDLYPERIPD